MRDILKNFKIISEIKRVEETIRRAEEKGLRNLKRIADKRLKELLNENK